MHTSEPFGKFMQNLQALALPQIIWMPSNHYGPLLIKVLWANENDSTMTFVS